MRDAGILLHVPADRPEVEPGQDGNSVKPAFTEQGKFFICISQVNDQIHLDLRFTICDLRLKKDPFIRNS